MLHNFFFPYRSLIKAIQKIIWSLSNEKKKTMEKKYAKFCKKKQSPNKSIRHCSRVQLSILFVLVSFLLSLSSIVFHLKVFRENLFL